MEQPSPFRTLPLVIAACCAAFIAVALFGGGRWWFQRDNTTDLAAAGGGTLSEVLKTYACPQCGRTIDWGTEFCSWCGWDRLRLLNPAALTAAPAQGPVVGPETEVEVNAARAAVPTQGPAVGPNTEVEINAAPNAAPTPGVTPAANMTPAANVVPAAAAAMPGSPGLLSPREQNAAGKEFIEGHWLGLETIPLTPELCENTRCRRARAGSWWMRSRSRRRSRASSPGTWSSPSMAGRHPTSRRFSWLPSGYRRKSGRMSESAVEARR